MFSHFLGALLFLSTPIYVFTTAVPARYAVATVADKTVCCIYFAGVATCFILSST